MLFGLIALRATGLGFLMLTLALSQVLWGTAYRWVSVTDGDNGLRGLTRPAPFGVSLDDSTAFYYFTLAVTAFSIWMMAKFVGSPFGAALRGTRDQPRRMSALGHDVWLIRWITFVYSGFWGAVSGLLFVYYNKYIHPSSLSLTTSAEAILSVIAGGSGTLAGPIIGAAIVVHPEELRVRLHRALEHAARLRLRRHRDLHARRHRAGRAALVGALESADA